MFIDEKLKSELQKLLSGLTNNVKLVLFTQELECQYCRETHQILSELADVSQKLSLEIKNLVLDKETAEKYSIEKIPAIILLNSDEKDYGIRFYGIPSGYEFSSLLESILLIGTGEHGLKPELVEQIKSINEPVHLQVFVTPTCPYCPQAVITAHKLSYLNENIKSDMIEATEFPHLSNKYNVRGVPRTIINEEDFLEGAAPEFMVLDKIMKSLEKSKVGNG